MAASWKKTPRTNIPENDLLAELLSDGATPGPRSRAAEHSAEVLSVPVLSESHTGPRADTGLQLSLFCT